MTAQRTPSFVSREPPRYQFGSRAIEVGHFLLECHNAGDCPVASFEAVHEAFPSLSFFDFMGGFVLADCIEADTLLVYPVEGGRA
jgi:hypothetical protein